jgi:hypothetical protein
MPHTKRFRLTRRGRYVALYLAFTAVFASAITLAYLIIKVAGAILAAFI